MADPLSIAGSVVGIAAAGVQVSISLFALAETVSTASQRVESIANDISSTCGILNQLHDLIDPKRRPDGTYTSMFTRTGLSDIAAACQHCHSLFRQVKAYLRKASSVIETTATPAIGEKIKLSKLEKTKWPFLQPQFNDLRNDLRDSKSNLLLMIAVANLGIANRSVPGRIIDEREKLEMTATVVRLSRAVTSDIKSFNGSEEEKENAIKSFFKKLAGRGGRSEKHKVGTRELDVDVNEDGGDDDWDVLRKERMQSRSVSQRAQADLNGVPAQRRAAPTTIAMAIPEPMPSVIRDTQDMAKEIPSDRPPSLSDSVRSDSPQPDGTSKITPPQDETERQSDTQEADASQNKDDDEPLQDVTEHQPVARDGDQSQNGEQVKPEAVVESVVEEPLAGVKKNDLQFSSTVSDEQSADTEEHIVQAVTTADAAVQTHEFPQTAPLQPLSPPDPLPPPPPPPVLEASYDVEPSSPGIGPSNPPRAAPESSSTGHHKRNDKGKSLARSVHDAQSHRTNDASEDGTESQRFVEQDASSILHAWSIGALPGVASGLDRSLTIHHLSMEIDEIEGLIQQQVSPLKALSKLNSHQRRLILDHVAAMESKLLYVDIWNQERLPTVFGELELVILIWVTKSKTAKPVTFDSDEYFRQGVHVHETSRDLNTKRERSGVKTAEGARDEAEPGLREERVKRAAWDSDRVQAYLDEAKAAAEEHEKAKKASEEEKEELAPCDAPLPPIRFKDCVGRKFSFPFHLVKKWRGMEDLIKQAFLHVDVIGPHVQEGHYDLVGPDGEIILPQVWEHVIQPDWNVTMHMWPMPEPPPVPRNEMPAPAPPPPPPPPPSFFVPPKTSAGKAKRKSASTKLPPPPPPPPPPHLMVLPPPPPPMAAGQSSAKKKKGTSSVPLPPQPTGIIPYAGSFGSSLSHERRQPSSFLKWAAGAGSMPKPGLSKPSFLRKARYDKTSDSISNVSSEVDDWSGSDTGKRKAKSKLWKSAATGGDGVGNDDKVVERLLSKWIEDEAPRADVLSGDDENQAGPSSGPIFS